eukprot:gene17863-biopygen20405
MKRWGSGGNPTESVGILQKRCESGGKPSKSVWIHQNRWENGRDDGGRGPDAGHMIDKGKRGACRRAGFSAVAMLLRPGGRRYTHRNPHNDGGVAGMMGDWGPRNSGGDLWGQALGN